MSLQQRPDLAARAVLAREIHRVFILTPPDPHHSELGDLAALLDRWAAGGVHGLPAFFTSPALQRPTDHLHG